MHTQQYILDNPVWNALISGNKALAQGTDRAKYFPADISPITGLQEYTAAHFDALYPMIDADRTLVVFTIEKNLVVPEPWKVLLRMVGYQMVYTRAALPAMPPGEAIVSLTDEHIPQMLALTSLTNPGPFSSRTIDFGHYEGVFRDDQLVAMAGQRLHPYNYAEISAVCTHPNYTGKGYAKQLLLRQMHRMVAAGITPFLHVKGDNSRAIEVYKSLGFEVRTEISFIVIQK